MRVLAVNATYRPGKTTSRLAGKALEGAASLGAQTEMVHLKELDIGFCTNCLTCYQDQESEIADCVLTDDVRGVLEKIRKADGVILASPVHNGFVSGLMTAFVERATWTTLKPTGEMMGLKGCPEPRLTGKARAVATLVSAGMMPAELRQYCDTGSPWLMEAGVMICNGSPVGDMYAGAVFPRELNDDEWRRAYFFREITEAQDREAFELGQAMAQAIAGGQVKPYDPMAMMAALEEGKE
ncbi:MAG: flavodoxin family protein [Proteobacteria bacterium]|nr:flavodoxin family protein [Pseudomonadota bacterium]MBU1450847.1 flavodoxin family protein [Pseudomonadota bacterium]MBU2470050.1 flavodoxin family protein [Pseudomonadota bacterium]MBU2518438.1 flavodoxin family protein [Pseudomonadota bacterium]